MVKLESGGWNDLLKMFNKIEKWSENIILNDRLA